MASGGKPDLSGEWVLDREASTLSPGADATQSAVWRIEHREPLFRHKASFVTTPHPVEFEYELQADGPEDAFTHEGARTVSSLRWEGDALVVTWRTERAGGVTVVSFRCELIDAGRRLRATEAVRGTDHDQDNIWVFDRR